MIDSAAVRRMMGPTLRTSRSMIGWTVAIDVPQPPPAKDEETPADRKAPPRSDSFVVPDAW